MRITRANPGLIKITEVTSQTYNVQPRDEFIEVNNSSGFSIVFIYIAERYSKLPGWNLIVKDAGGNSGTYDIYVYCIPSGDLEPLGKYPPSDGGLMDGYSYQVINGDYDIIQLYSRNDLIHVNRI